MADEAARSRLGRGLAALMGDVNVEAQPSERHQQRSQRRVPIEFVRANPRNPRKLFSDAELVELTDSIRERGIIQPIVVRARGTDNYEIIAGERRWRAAQMAGLHDVPVIVRDVDDKEALELAIIENVQRADLNPLEEAMGYGQLIEQFDYTQQDLAQVIGKSRSHVANTLRLLRLPEDVRGMVASGTLTAGHARTLITAEDPARLARQIVDGGLSVREAEALSQQREVAGTKRSATGERDADTVALERRLSDALGLSVALAHSERGGKLEIRYKTLEQLDGLCRRLKN